jgi:hypothetical protein
MIETLEPSEDGIYCINCRYVGRQFIVTGKLQCRRLVLLESKLVTGPRYKKLRLDCLAERNLGECGVRGKNYRGNTEGNKNKRDAIKYIGFAFIALFILVPIMEIAL